jgi:hypothetical protein
MIVKHRIKKIFWRTVFSLIVLALAAVPAFAAHVAVTVEKLPLGEGFIVAPELVELSDSDNGASVLIELLYSKYIYFEFYIEPSMGFFLSAIRDPSNNKLLGMSMEKPMAGWMVSVNNAFINRSAGFYELSDGDVMRWQYTEAWGADIGGNADNPGAGSRPSKDDLIWKVAEMNAAGNNAGEAYKNALSVLGDLGAAAERIEAELAALDGDGNGKGEEPPNHPAVPDDQDDPEDPDNPDDPAVPGDPSEPDYPAISVGNGGTVGSDAVDDAITKAENADQSTIPIKVDTGSGGKDAAVKISANDLLKVANSTVENVTFFNTAIGEVTLNMPAIRAVLAEAGEETVEVAVSRKYEADKEELLKDETLTEAQKTILKDERVRDVYDISLRAGDKELLGKPALGVELTIGLPYELKSGEKSSNVGVSYIGKDGAEPMSAAYNGDSKLAVFTTTHLSLYGVTYTPVSAGDNGGGGGCNAGFGVLALLALALTGGIRGREK